MTRFECETALIRLGEAAMEIVRLYNAEINLASITFSPDGYVCVSGARMEDGYPQDAHLLEATKFTDGEIAYYGTSGGVA